jgi:hypothetical protein
LNTLLFLAIFISVALSPAFAQESAPHRVEALRGHLSEVQTAYSEAINKPGGEAAAARLERLRLDLRERLGDLIKKATSSEATLAVYRADAEATLDAVRAYEKALAVGPGEQTTFWNVHSGAELEKMRGLTQKRLDALNVERLNTPPKDVTPSLEFRIREVEGWLDGLKSEIARRGGNEQVRLKPIRGDLSADDARARYAEIGGADGQIGRDQHFQRKLALQVRVRLHNAPNDAALATLRDTLPDVTPPSVSSTAIRGPPNSAEIARNQLQAAHLDELKATTRRDPVAIAESRARAATSRKWLDVALKKQPAADKFGFSETPDEHLLNIRDGWQKWHDRLVLEKQPLSASSAAVDLQLKEAQDRIRDIDVILERRLLPRPPPDSGGSSLASVPDGPPPQTGPELRAFAKTWDRQLAHNELTELAEIANQHRAINNVEVGEAAAKAFQARVSGEAQSIRAAYDETLQLQRKLLISGRGAEASESGKQLQQARKLIQSAAHELRTSLADPRLGADPAVRAATTSLADIPRPSSPITSGGLEQGLTALERARDAVETSAHPPDMQIHSLADGEASPGPAYRIRLAGKPPEGSSSLVIKPPDEYTTLYPKNVRRQTLPEIIKDPKRAPGGVIIDAELPMELSRRLNGLEVDVNSGAVKVSLDGSWRTLKMRADPLLSRTAWAFVLDGRSAVIDLRPLKDYEAMWLLLQYGDRHLASGEQREVLQQLAGLTSVNVNDALRDTPMVSRLVTADQLMFELLPRSTLAIEGEDTRYGLPLRELRRAFRADAGAELNKQNWQDVLFNKSILAVSQISYEEGAELVISPKLSFNLFGVMAKGNDILRLPASERWFADHERELSQLPQLSQLVDFAALVTLFRAAHERNVPHNLDDLIAVTVPASDAPRFIFRRSRVSPDSWRRLQDSLSGKER